MVAALLCPSCQPSVLMPDVDPSHCYGMGDRPALPGVLGGNRCSCMCRAFTAAPPRDAIRAQLAADLAAAHAERDAALAEVARLRKRLGEALRTSARRVAPIPWRVP